MTIGTPTLIANAPRGPRNSYFVVRGFSSDVPAVRLVAFDFDVDDMKCAGVRRDQARLNTRKQRVPSSLPASAVQYAAEGGARCGERMWHDM